MVDMKELHVGDVFAVGHKLFKVINFDFDGWGELTPCIARESDNLVDSNHPFSYVQKVTSGERWGCCGGENVFDHYLEAKYIYRSSALLDDITHEIVTVSLGEGDVLILNGKPLTMYNMLRFRPVEVFVKCEIVSVTFVDDFYRIILGDGKIIWASYSQWASVQVGRKYDTYSYIYSPKIKKFIMF